MIKSLNNFLKVFLLFVTITFSSKLEGQVTGYSLSTNATQIELGTSFPVSVVINWAINTTSATATIKYRKSLVSYDATQTNLPTCMSLFNNTIDSTITITINSLSSCGAGSVLFPVGFVFNTPDSCTGVNKVAVFNGQITDNFNTTILNTNSCIKNGILTNNVLLQNNFYSYNSVNAEVTFRIYYYNNSFYKIKKPRFNITLTTLIPGCVISSIYGNNYTYTLTGSTVTKNDSTITRNQWDYIYYVVKLPCNSGVGQTLKTDVTLLGYNCGNFNSTIKVANQGSYLIPVNAAATPSIEVTTQVSSSWFKHRIKNIGNTPLNLIDTSFIPLVHVTGVQQNTSQSSILDSVKYINCSSSSSAFYPLNGNGVTNINIPTTNTKQIVYKVYNLQKDQWVDFYTFFNTVSSCNGAAGTAPFKDSLRIAYNCVAPPNPCVSCGPGGVIDTFVTYNPLPVFNCVSNNNMTSCKGIGDTIEICQSFSNIGDAPLITAIYSVPLPAGFQAIPSSVIYTGFNLIGNPTVVSGSNIKFNLPTLPVSTSTYSICVKAIIQSTALSGTYNFNNTIASSNYNNLYACSKTLKVCAIAAIKIVKKVKGNLNPVFIASGQGAPNTLVEYEITLSNSGTIPLDSLVVIDRIPNIGNLTVMGNPQSVPVPNMFSMEMQTPTSSNYNAFYTNTQNICTNWPTVGSNCNPGNWTDPLSNSTKGVKFIFNTGFTLAPGASHTFTFQTKIPVGAGNTFKDCNTASFIARTVGTGVTLYPTESDTACITVVNPCPINVNPNFTAITRCVKNNFRVVVTSTQTTVATHVWSLYQTSVCGSTSAANTLNGGLPLATITQTNLAGASAVTSFIIASSGACYYIKHRIYVAGCYDTTISMAFVVPPFNNVFNLENASGLVKDNFCLGEPVYFDGTASVGENLYSIEILRRAAGTSSLFSSYVNLGTFTGTAGLLNLSQMLLNLSTPLYFETDFEYAVKYTIFDTTRGCVAAIESTKPFSVICCSDFISANFQLGLVPTAVDYVITTYLFTTYPAANPTHEWYVLSSPNQGTGPYTPEFSSTDSTLSFPHAQYNFYYTVIHKIKTKCGEVCSFVEIYESLSNRSVEAVSIDCCLATQYWANGAGNPPQGLSAEFDIDYTNLGGGQYTINTYPGYSYSTNPSIIHEWFVLTSPNASGGPYSLVDQATGFNYTYSPANDGLYYFVIHKVKTPCGEVCYGQSTCRNCNNKAQCELCGKIDCKLLDEILPKCFPPIKLVSNCRRGTLSWDIVPAAGGYQVELSYNDPKCCNSRYAPLGNQIDLSTNSLVLADYNHPKYNCIRWRVRAKCENGYSEWSEWSCYYCEIQIVIEEQPLITKAKVANNGVLNTLIMPEVSPNPNNGVMNLKMETKGPLALSIDVYNEVGVLVKNVSESKYLDGKYVSKLNLGTNIPKGLYLIVFKTNYGVYTKRIVIN